MSSTLPVRVGIVSWGFAATIFHAPMVLASGGALELVAVATSQAEPKALPAGVRVFATPPELLACEAVELVVVATPNETHFSLAKAALEAGKHVLVDKPFTVTSAEAEELVALAAERKLQLAVYHNRRFDGDFRTVRALLADKALGRVTVYRSHFDRFRPDVLSRWRESDLPGGGLLYDLGPHLLDQVLLLFGMPDKLQADTAIQRENGRAVDYFQVTLYYGHMRAIVSGSTLVKAATPHYAIHGTRGSFTKYGLDSQEDALRTSTSTAAATAQPDFGVDRATGTLDTLDTGATPQAVPMQRGSYIDFYKQLAQAVRGQAELPASGADGLAVVRLIELALQSAAEGRVVLCK